ncbi:MAG: hypothetical protein JWN76_2007 [Chitinophagaceae bacterium]|nr:hypothetical protein [Chitinophagaceae bacterium]
MKILFLSTSIPPVADSHTIRNVYFLRSLARYSSEVVVVTIPSKQGKFMTDELPQKVKIITTEPTIYDTINSLLDRIPAPKVRNFSKSFLAVFFGRIGIPDYRGDWSRKARKASIQYFKENNFQPDLIISSAGSFSANIAAANIARKYNIKWIADYGDPWSFSVLKPASLWYLRTINGLIEKRTLKYCSYITVTTNETKVYFEQNLVGFNIPISVIPCGYTKVDHSSTLHKTHFRGICIGYVGTAYSGSRDLRSFMEIFKKLQDTSEPELSFLIVGSYSSGFKVFIEQNEIRNVTLKGWVGYFESISLMQNLDFLLLYGNISEYQIPGKVYNYLSTGKPIIYFSQIQPDKDPTYKLLSQFEGVIYIDSQRDNAFEILQNHISKYKVVAEIAKSRLSNEMLGKFEWGEIGEDFANLALKVLGKQL